MSCERCVCRTCSNEVNALYENYEPREQDFPCFSCDDCSQYGWDHSKSNNRKTTCDKYRLASKVAERLEYIKRRKDEQEGNVPENLVYLNDYIRSKK